MEKPNFLSTNELTAIKTVLDGLNAVDYDLAYVNNVTIHDVNGEALGTVSYDYGQKQYVFYMGELNDD